MAKKLYVGNLSYNVTEDQLRNLFADIGEITELALITDRYTGQSKGFAFVEMATEEASQEAIRRLNGQDLENRSLVVSEARPREGGGGGGGYGNRRNDSRGRDGGGGRRRY